MRLSEIRDQFLMQLKRECLKKNLPVPATENTMIAFDISEAQQEIQRRLKVVEKSASISLSAGYNTFNLPSDFGQHKAVTISDIPIKEMSTGEIQGAQSSVGETLGFAILVSGNSQYLMIYPTPSSTITAVLYYYPDFNFYQPSGASAQNWGTFDGDTFTGKLQLPDRYAKAVLLYMMSKWFDEFVAKYEVELKLLRSARVISYKDTMDYNLGWDEERQVSQGGYVQTIQSEYSKRLRITMIEGAQPVIVLTEGFAGAITATESGGKITISSASSEFVQPNTLVKTEPLDLNYTIDPATIEIDTYSGHDPISIEIKVW